MVVILCATLIFLGCWQLNRAQQKRELSAQHQSLATIDPLQLIDLMQVDELPQFRSVQVSGEYDNHHQLLLDNRFYQHQLGYEVLTPLHVGEIILLVNRGWIPRGSDRRQLPTLAPIVNQQTLTGTIYYPPRRNFTLSNKAEFADTWPRIIQKIEPSQFSAILAKPVTPFILRLNADQAHGFVRDWPVVTMLPEKHIGYAWQWFIMAAVLAVSYFFLILNKNE